MAEYYPLLSRAVAGLRDGAPEARQAIYARAKQALVGQLRSMDPPVPEEDIARETTALDDAIARIESEIAGSAKPAPADPAPMPHPAAPETPAEPSPPTAPVLPVQPPAPQTTTRPSAPILGGAQPVVPRPERPIFSPRSGLPPLRPTALRVGAEFRDGVAATQRPSIPTVTEPPPAKAEEGEALESKPALPTAPKLDVPVPDRRRAADEAGAAARRDANADASSEQTPPERPSEPRPRDDGPRPAAPRPVHTQRRNLRAWIVAAVVLLAVAAVALAAWKLRDRPEELVRAPAAGQPVVTPGKIVERADSAQSPDADVADPEPPTPIVTAAGTAQPAAPAAPAPAAPQAVETPNIPVAYKAAILVDAPDEPQKVKTFIGTVVWRTESVTQGQDQPLGTAIRADIDIPDAKIQLVMQMRKNMEAQFPASHTIELKFTVGPDSSVGGIKQINVPQLRREDMPTGESLVGVPVTITDNYFLVGLTRGDAETHNLDEVRTHGWFDVPMLLNSGKPAKITFEKGASGERIINEALQAWAKP